MENATVWPHFRPTMFEKLMEQVLKGLSWQTILLYLDDVIDLSKDFERHVDRLVKVCQCSRAAKLKLHPENCNLFQREMQIWNTL